MQGRIGSTGLGWDQLREIATERCNPLLMMIKIANEHGEVECDYPALSFCDPTEKGHLGRWRNRHNDYNHSTDFSGGMTLRQTPFPCCASVHSS